MRRPAGRVGDTRGCGGWRLVDRHRSPRRRRARSIAARPRRPGNSLTPRSPQWPAAATGRPAGYCSRESYPLSHTRAIDWSLRGVGSPNQSAHGVRCAEVRRIYTWFNSTYIYTRYPYGMHAVDSHYTPRNWVFAYWTRSVNLQTIYRSPEITARNLSTASGLR